MEFVLFTEVALHTGVVTAEGNPRRDYVVWKHSKQYQQVCEAAFRTTLEGTYLSTVLPYYNLFLILVLEFRCLEEGAEDFLLKPIRPSDLLRLCSRMLWWEIAACCDERWEMSCFCGGNIGWLWACLHLAKSFGCERKKKGMEMKKYNRFDGG